MKIECPHCSGSIEYIECDYCTLGECDNCPNDKLVIDNE